MLPTTLAASLALALPAPSLAQASAAIASGGVKPSALSPGEIVAAAPAKDWVAIAPADLLVMTLAPDLDPGSGARAGGNRRQVVIQLMPPPFSQGWIGNIRKLAAAHWWDGLSINRVQDNYVVQWGDANAEDQAKAKALPEGLLVMHDRQYVVREGDAGSDAIQRAFMNQALVGLSPSERQRAMASPEGLKSVLPKLKRSAANNPRDAYAEGTWLFMGWPVGGIWGETWPVHCYGMVGVGRDLSPDTGSGAELYTVIGHAPRHLDRNIALVGRVVDGIEHLSSLPRGTLALGFYAEPEQRVPIQSIRLASELPKADQPRFEYLSTESDSFAKYADARANRRDPFFNIPAGGADICNIPVPVRRAPAPAPAG